MTRKTELKSWLLLMIPNAFLLLSTCQIGSVAGHARLMEPPSRSSMWRYGFPTLKNWDDDGLYCGGISNQWKINGGKCGLCGDAWNARKPRSNEAGGKYGKGIISRVYKSGQAIEVVLEITANHKGYFEFRLCPNNNPKKEATQECLDNYILSGVTNNKTRHSAGKYGTGRTKIQLQLPEDLNCTQCVFQWTYVAGNNWGKCKNGRKALGCGPQETFRACSDISIGSDIQIDSKYLKVQIPAYERRNWNTRKPSKRPRQKSNSKKNTLKRTSSSSTNVTLSNINGTTFTEDTSANEITFGQRLVALISPLLHPG